MAHLRGTNYKLSPYYEEGEKVLLDLSVQITQNANKVSTALWDRVRTHWSESQSVEIVYVITSCTMVNLFASALQIDPEPVFDNVKTQLA